ncbi:translation factor SUA5 [Frankia casuarinae]|uniref:L-threonylcarbamoyladenylate synthase n=1 Tax=Frankia casuarinae (strain DSM 45818 / CECT 9043 / HFP020203 / CcI3) TaxID=106370 RepID=Q2J6M2_FRACC|nr:MULTISPECIES: L-threonylcarbamoyladenylate synthase [Frankia]ABD13070.1 translation factor SUA5 [Frankia casuarinae]ETA01750.1 translation factor SUA5 [Frankia sp. CcI6]EYT92420.1 translation factor SUA5 [Frankia casuarinae]KDA42248.1 translation factor SUA5 [Frankia sp. BMG5.23]KEZ35205.1 translation factor SUA5 [Frankia sp. CeD]
MERFDCSDERERARGLDAAVSTVARGGLVVLPTDTLYGLGADAFDRDAVASLLAAKGRGRNMPVPVLVGSWRTLDGLIERMTPQVRELITAFWPGGLTLVARHTPSLRWDLGESRGTVAVRMPLHPVAIELLGRTGPMAVSSANISGQPPATTIDEALHQLGGAADVYLDGGPCPAAVPSTIVDCTGEVPVVLRSGAIGLTALRAVLPLIREPVNR